MDMFKMLKEAAAMKSKLGDMDKALRKHLIDIEVNGVKVQMNAKSDLLDIKLSPDLMKQDVSKVEKSILSAVQQAIKKSHDVMAEEAKKITGGMNIPGLM